MDRPFKILFLDDGTLRSLQLEYKLQNGGHLPLIADSELDIPNLAQNAEILLTYTLASVVETMARKANPIISVVHDHRPLCGGIIS